MGKPNLADKSQPREGCRERREPWARDKAGNEKAGEGEESGSCQGGRLRAEPGGFVWGRVGMEEG